MSLSACSPGFTGDVGEFSPLSAATSSSPEEPQVDAPGAELSPPAPRPSSETVPLPRAQPLDVLAEEDSQLTVTEVRSGSHATFDRVVVELAGDGSPGWYVSTTDRPVTDGSGRAVDYIGETALVIDVRGLTGHGNPDKESPATPIDDAATETVRSITPLGISEGVQRVVIGLDKADPTFNVNVLDGPTRIVVDILDTPERR